jgi:hypothetical protein
MSTRTIRCDCGAEMHYKGRGRPPRRCFDCKREYYEQNKAEIAAKQREYREQNKAEIAAKKREREGRLCSQCGETLRHPTETGLCGFCESEAQEAA